MSPHTTTSEAHARHQSQGQLPLTATREKPAQPRRPSAAEIKEKRECLRARVAMMVVKCGQIGDILEGRTTEFAGRQSVREIESYMNLSFLASMQDFQKHVFGYDYSH